MNLNTINIKLQKVESLSEFRQAVDYIAPETPYNTLKNKQAKKLLDEISEDSKNYILNKYRAITEKQ